MREATWREARLSTLKARLECGERSQYCVWLRDGIVGNASSVQLCVSQTSTIEGRLGGGLERPAWLYMGTLDGDEPMMIDDCTHQSK